MLDWPVIWTALGLTLIAGLSTGIGAGLSLLARRDDTRVLAGALGLSAGVMIYVSFMELMPEAVSQFGLTMTHRQATWWMLVAFFGGIGLMALIDRLVPEDENPHEAHTLDELDRPDSHHLKRTGLMLTLAIGIHNFPEGIATFVSALEGLDVALPIVLAVAVHNIPEGVAVSVPVYHATGSRRKAFWLSTLSGLAEVVGALLAMLFLLPVWSPAVSGACLAAVSGIMIYISFDELLPNAHRYGHHHLSLAGLIFGMALMALTLLIL